MLKNENQKRWYFGNWQILGWIESGLKIFAFMFAFLQLYNVLSIGNFEIPHGEILIVWIIQIILSIGLFAAIFDRYNNKEIFAMIFVLFNNLAHWGITFSIANTAGLSLNLILFYSFMLLGDLVKILFLRTSGFKVDRVPQSVMYGLTGIFIAGYSSILFILLF
jgi:hypothetical protein